LASKWSNNKMGYLYPKINTWRRSWRNSRWVTAIQWTLQ